MAAAYTENTVGCFFFPDFAVNVSETLSEKTEILTVLWSSFLQSRRPTLRPPRNSLPSFHQQFRRKVTISWHLFRPRDCRERKCADTIATVLVPWAGQWPFPMLKYKHIFQIKYTEAILSNSTRKLLWFEIAKMLIAVKKINLLCYLL